MFVGRLLAHPRPNLTGARTPEDAWTILLEPSLAVGEAWPAERGGPRVIVDIGSGNGFPGMAAAALWPAAQVHLVERRGRKAAALDAHVRASGHGERVRVHAEDARDLLDEAHGLVAAADLVLLRAVGALGPTTSLGAPFVAPGGRLVHWKGQGLDAAERQEGERVARALGLVALADRAGPQGTGRHLLLFERPPRPPVRRAP